MDCQQFKERLKLAWKILKNRDSNLVAHTQREVAYMRTKTNNSPNDWIANHLVDVARVFSAEGHSGMSAAYAIGAINKVLGYQPLRPLTGDEDEWGEPYCDAGTRQNKRCSTVFIEPNGFAYNIDGVVFREPGGSCFAGELSRVRVEFPYTPKTIYVDVPLGASDEELAQARAKALGLPDPEVSDVA